MTDRPDQQLLDVRMHALTLAVGATAPLDGLQPQLEVVHFASYLEAWLLRPAERTENFAEVEAEMEAELDKKSGRFPGAAQIARTAGAA